MKGNTFTGVPVVFIVALNPRSNWNLEVLVFVEGGKSESPEKNHRSKDENQQQTQPTYDAGSVKANLGKIRFLLAGISLYLTQGSDV